MVVWCDSPNLVDWYVYHLMYLFFWWKIGLLLSWQFSAVKCSVCPVLHLLLSPYLSDSWKFVPFAWPFLTWQFSVPVGAHDKVELSKEIITILLTNPTCEHLSHSTSEAWFSVVLYQKKRFDFSHLMGFQDLHEESRLEWGSMPGYRQAGKT